MATELMVTYSHSSPTVDQALAGQRKCCVVASSDLRKDRALWNAAHIDLPGRRLFRIQLSIDAIFGIADVPHSPIPGRVPTKGFEIVGPPRQDSVVVCERGTMLPAYIELNNTNGLGSKVGVWQGMGHIIRSSRWPESQLAVRVPSENIDA